MTDRERVNVRLTKQTNNNLERLVDEGPFLDKSELIRHFIREGLKETNPSDYDFDTGEPEWK